MKHLFLVFVTIAIVAFTSCKKEEAEVNVKVNLSASPWQELLDNGQCQADKSSPKSSSIQYPVRLYFVRDGETSFTRTLCLASADDDFNLAVPTGSYTVYALCGVSNDNDAPASPASLITLSSTLDNLPDVQLGSTNVTVNQTNNASISIAVSHIFTRMNVTITGVPDLITSINVFVKDLYDNILLNGTFDQSDAGYRMISTSGSNNSFSGSKILFPSHSTPNMDIAVEAKDANGKTMLLHTNINASTSGSDYTVTLQYADLVPIQGGITVNDWATTTGNGTLAGFSFYAGDQYFNYPATVLYCSAQGKKAFIFSHKPVTLTKSQLVNSLTTSNHALPSYNEIPGLQVSYWYVPGGDSQPDNFRTLLAGSLPLASLNARITATGGTPIDPTATNVLAYCAYDADNHPIEFHCYDFQNNTYTTVQNVTDNTQFIIYPIGKIELY